MACCKNTKAIGCVIALAGIILVLCCVPIQLWLAVLGCLLAAVGVHILIG